MLTLAASVLLASLAAPMAPSAPAGKPDAEVEVVTRQGDVTLKLPAKPGGDLPAVIRLRMKRSW